MIILQKCLKILYQAENKQSAGLFHFHMSVCLQSSLPACLSLSLPHIEVSPAREVAVPLPALLGPRRQMQFDSTGCEEPHLHPERGGNLTSFYLLPSSPQILSSQGRVGCPQCWEAPCLPSDVSSLGEDRATAADSWGAHSREGDNLQPRMAKPPGAHDQ